MMGGLAWGLGQVGMLVWTWEGHTSILIHTCCTYILSLYVFSFKTNNMQIHPPTASFTPPLYTDTPQCPHTCSHRAYKCHCELG